MEAVFELPGMVRFPVDAISQRNYAAVCGGAAVPPNQSFDYGSPAAALWLER